MRILSRAKRFLILDNQTKRIFLEAFFYLGLARILILFPFSKISPSLGENMTETSLMQIKPNVASIKNIYHAIEIMSRYTFWQSKCLVRAIAAMKMLERRKIESTLYLGIAKEDNGELVAHAWLRSGSFFVTGAEGMESYTVVGKFAKKFNRKGKGYSHG